MEQFINSQGTKHKQERLMAKKKELMLQLKDVPAASGYKLEDYVNIDMPQVNADSGFGRYLFVNRAYLSIEELEKQYGNLSQIDMINAASVINQSIPAKHEQDEAKAFVWSKLSQMCDKTHWQNGFTAEKVKDGLMIALGMSDAPLSEKETEVSQVLWNQFIKRVPNDPEKSFRLTWLSFVGWSISHLLIKGGHGAENGRYPPTQNGDIRSLFRLFSLMAM